MDDPVLARRSIRAYTAEPVTDEQVARLLRAAMAAPSAGNQQPWRFLVVTNRATLTKIPSVHPYSRMLAHVPLAIVVCGVEKDQRWPQFWVQDCSAAVENILIEAVLLGLGAVWLGVYPIDERVQGLRRLLGIPDDVIPLAVVPIGHPAENREAADRYDPGRVHRERW
ncbi:MAG: nitroreductase family protein [Thermoleophilia bacterium]